MSSSVTSTDATLNDAVNDALTKAFTNPTGNLTKTVKIVENGQDTGRTKPRFILTSGDYLDVKAYTTAGMQFPVTVDAFRSLHPKENLDKLVELDVNIYDETQNAMVDVSQRCKSFSEDALPNFRIITNEIQVYATYAKLQLTGLGDASFQGLLDILTNEKYKDEGSENTDEFRGATLAASDILLDLSKNAMEKVESIKSLTKQILSFEGGLESDKVAVVKLCAKYMGDGTLGAGYMGKLNTSLGQLRKDIQTATDAARAALDEWNHDNEQAKLVAAYIWIPIAGWIAGPIMSSKWSRWAREAYALYEQELGVEASKGVEVKHLEAVISDVNLLSNQNTTINDKMAKARKALGEIEDLFTNISSEMSLASSMMGAAEGIVHKGYYQRFLLLKSRVDQAVKEWQDVLDSSQELAIADDNIKTEGINSSVTAPRIAEHAIHRQIHTE